MIESIIAGIIWGSLVTYGVIEGNWHKCHYKNDVIACEKLKKENQQEQEKEGK